jgi:beta-carotene 3-hydroxylase
MWLIVGFAAMEPVTYLVHRFVMHGWLWQLHASHHAKRPNRWERNDWFPVMFASIVMLAMAAGFNVGGAHVIVPLAVGTTLYGIAYACVHDVYTHRRFGLFRRRSALLEPLARAHRAHHQFGAEPYGMLLPLKVARAAPRSADSHVSGRVDTVPGSPRT